MGNRPKPAQGISEAEREAMWQEFWATLSAREAEGEEARERKAESARRKALEGAVKGAPGLAALVQDTYGGKLNRTGGEQRDGEVQAGAIR